VTIPAAASWVAEAAAAPVVWIQITIFNTSIQQLASCRSTCLKLGSEHF
jgi:hypothetical protein